MASLLGKISPFLLLVFATLCHGDEQQSIHCAYANNPTLNDRQNGSTSLPKVNRDNPGESGEILADNRTMRCRGKRDSCYTLWSVDPTNQTGPTVLMQGCWDQPDPSECSNDGGCVSEGPPIKAANNTRFCCCRDNMCNTKFIDAYVPGSITEESASSGFQRYDPSYKTKTIVIALSSVFCVAVVIGLAYLIIRLSCSQPHESLDPLFLGEDLSTPSFELDDLKLDELLQKGRYGEVWKGTLDDIDVAVKLFTPGQKQYYLNERDIYKLEFMDHDSLPRFYGADERIHEGQTQYVIVMSYIQEGTLTNYLKHNTLDWSTLCRMCHSIVSGLAHLHTDISKGDKCKPAVAHRDFNSRNILVKPDLSCCICDFGFAMKIMGRKYIRNGHEEIAEQASLSDVGTLRYMAPEVIEGAVNLRDCESSLKQIDIYALGLVFWEVGTRCADLYQGMPVPEYQLPFQAEIGLHPMFEDMQLLVKKSRPVFPDVWKDSNQAIRAFKDTIEDCWDQDAEARLTALCVEERVMEMTTLWETRHKGVTPTIHTSCLGALEEKAVIQRNPTSSSQTVSQSTDPASSEGGTLNDNDGNLGSDSTETPSNVHRQNARMSHSENSVSAASTVETVLSPSESGELVPNKSNRNALYARTSRALQPHQGQNPTVERNTHKRSDEELAVLGNTLVDKSVKEAAGSSLDRDNVTHAANNSTVTDELLDAIADRVESSLVQNDFLTHQQRSYAKPNVLNQVNLSEPSIVRRKQHNVPGNGSVNLANQNLGPSNLNPDVKPKMWFGKGKKKADKENKDKGGKLRMLFSKGLLSKGSSNQEVDRSSRDSPEPGVSGLGAEGHRAGYSLLETKIPNTEVEPRPVSTEVLMVNGQPVVRPTSLALGRGNGDSSAEAPGGAPNRQHPNLLGVAEVGVAKLQPAEVNGGGQPVYVKHKSHSNLDLSPTSAQAAVDTQPYSRPRSINSIPNTINAPARNMIHNDTRSNNIHAARAASQSPEKNERYSWCSENLNTGNPSIGSLPPENWGGNQSAFSLQQFSNVDADVSAIHAADYRC